MTHCPACGSEVSAASRFCDSCGSSLSSSEAPTRTSSPSALPAGDTPSPEMVAQAGEDGRLEPRIAWSLLAVILVGLLMLSMNWTVPCALPQPLDVAPIPPQWSVDTGLALMGGRQWIGAAAAALSKVSVFLFVPVMIVALVRLLVRKTWLAVGLCLLFFFFMLWPSAASPVPHLIGTPLLLGLFFFVLLRFGFLAIAAAASTVFLANEMPITPDPSSWFFSSTVITLALIAALALYGFKIALPRRATVRAFQSNGP